MSPKGLLRRQSIVINCNAPGVVGVESDAGDRECNAVLFNAPTHHRVLTIITAPNTGNEQICSSTTEPKVTIINPAQQTGGPAV